VLGAVQGGVVVSEAGEDHDDGPEADQNGEQRPESKKMGQGGEEISRLVRCNSGNLFCIPVPNSNRLTH